MATARWLGPTGKGALSALLLIGHGFLFYALLLGLGDASIYLIKSQRASVQRAVSASLPVLAVTSLLGIAFLFVVAVLADWSGIAAAVWITGLGLAAWIHLEFLTGILNSQERIPFTSTVRAFVSIVTTVATLILVGPLDLGVVGGTVAVLIGVTLGLGWLMISVHRGGTSFRPRWDPEYIRSALRFGIPNQASFLLLAVAQRFDQLVVYSLRGEAEGGLYSVALTMGWLITYLPAALTRAAWPRLAQMADFPARGLLAQILRVNVLAAAAVGIALAALLPVVVPVVFGDAYRSSVAPALLILIGGFFWSFQWTLSRAAAARGRPNLLVVTLGVNFAVMLGLDLLFVPLFGMVGAAAASIAGAVCGLVTSLVLGAARGIAPNEFIPGRADLRQLATSLRAEFREEPRSDEP